MIRILGNNLDEKKQIYIALTAIYGIGQATSLKILKSLNINPNSKLSKILQADLTKIREYLAGSKLKLEGSLKKYISANIQKLININSYRGQRHLKALPVRGQRTRTNRKTAKKIRFFKKKK